MGNSFKICESKLTLSTRFFALFVDPHDPAGEEVDGRGRGGGSMHVPDQLCEPVFPLNVRLRLDPLVGV